MGLNLTSKKVVVAEISEIASKAHALVATEYHDATTCPRAHYRCLFAGG